MDARTPTTPQLKNPKWKIFPCVSWAADDREPDPARRGKRPLTPNGLHDASNDPTVIAAWQQQFPGCNWGIPAEANGLAIVDIDSAEAEAKWFDLQLLHGQVPETFTVITPRGRHLYFAGTIKNTAGVIGPGIDSRGVGGYCMAAGSFVNGVTYREENLDAAIAPLPAWVLAASGRKHEAAKAAPSPATGAPAPYAAYVALLHCCPPDAKRETWLKVCGGMTGLPTLIGAPADFDPHEDWLKWCRGGFHGDVCPPTYKGVDDCEDMWRRDVEKHQRGEQPLAFGAWVQHARDNYGFKERVDIVEPNPAVAALAAGSADKEEAPAPTVMDFSGPEYSEINCASIFVSANKHRLRYTASEKRWDVFVGTYWRQDDVKAVRNLVREGLAAESISILSKSATVAYKLASSRSIAAVEAIAQAYPEIAATVDHWDTDTALLCTPGGTVDLMTGEMRKADPLDYCRKITAVAPAAPGTPAPLFRGVLDNITSGDTDVEEYLQRVAAYCLFGRQTDKAFFVPVGETDSGKTCLFESMASAMGDYATSAQADLFLDPSKHGFDRSTNDLAEIDGYRFVVASEPNKDRNLSASRLKRIVGSDSSRNRLLYRQGNSGETTYKVILHCNDVPHLGHPDAALMNRLHIIPAGRTIPNEKRVHDLKAKIKLLELPQVLRWMIDGCASLHKNGLAKPGAVKALSARYFHSEDPFTQWLDESTERDPKAWTGTTELWNDFQRQHPLTAYGVRAFSQRLQKTFEPKHTNKGEGFLGIKLKPRLNPIAQEMEDFRDLQS